MIKKQLRGFTIIELLVVVAIIAVLAAIVLVNVTQYINQGKNAAIKGNLSTILTNGAVFFDSPSLGNGTYTGFCTSSYVTAPQAAINAAYGSGSDFACNVNAAATGWCACSKLKTTVNEIANSTFCVDSTGYKKVTQNAALCSGTGGRCLAVGACAE